MEKYVYNNNRQNSIKSKKANYYNIVMISFIFKLSRNCHEDSFPGFLYLYFLDAFS